MSLEQFKRKMQQIVGVSLYEITPNANVSTLKVHKICSVTGKEYSVVITALQYNQWRSGKYVQDVAPELSDEQREFLITHYTPEEQKQLYGTSDNNE